MLLTTFRRPSIQVPKTLFNVASHVPWVTGGDSVELAVPVGFSVQSFLLQASDGVVLCFVVNSEVSSLHKDDQQKVKTEANTWKAATVHMKYKACSCYTQQTSPSSDARSCRVPTVQIPMEKKKRSSNFCVSNLCLLPASEINVVVEEVTHVFLAHLALQRL